MRHLALSPVPPARVTRGGGEAYRALLDEGARESAPLKNSVRRARASGTQPFRSPEAPSVGGGSRPGRAGREGRIDPLVPTGCIPPLK